MSLVSYTGSLVSYTGFRKSLLTLIILNISNKLNIGTNFAHFNHYHCIKNTFIFLKIARRQA